MTENEAIEKLKNMRLYMQITDKNILFTSIYFINKWDNRSLCAHNPKCPNSSYP